MCRLGEVEATPGIKMVMLSDRSVSV